MIESIRIVRMTSSFEAMRDFYENQLDMRPIAFWDRAEDDKGVILVFNGRTSTTSVEILSAVEGSFEDNPAIPDDSVSVSFEVENVGASYEEIVSRGVVISEEPENKPWGHRSFAVRDPDGFLLTFYQDMNR